MDLYFQMKKLLTFLYLLIISIPIYSSFDIIPVTNFETLSIHIGANYSNTILSFSNDIIPKYTTITMKILLTDFIDFICIYMII